MAIGERPVSALPRTFARIAENAPVGLFETDCDGALTFVSPQWLQMTGLSESQALGFGWMEYIPESDRDIFRSRWMVAIASQSAADLSCQLAFGDRDLRLRFLMAPIGPDNSARKRFAGVTTDVSRMESRSLQYRTIAEAMPNLVWVADADGKITYFNSRWHEYTGTTTDEAPPDINRSVVHPEDLSETRERWEHSLQTGEPFELEYRLRSAHDGTYRWFVARALPVRTAEGVITNWIGTATDIDAQRHATDNLRFIIEASSAFSSMYNVDDIARTLAHIAITSVADWCFVVLRENDGTYAVRAIAHRDPARVRWIEKYRDQYPVRPNSTTDIVTRKGISVLTPEIRDEDLVAGAENEEHLRLLRECRFQSAMTVPLKADSGTIYGALVMISSESVRQFTNDDLEVAERVARRASSAMETAIEFQQERARMQRLRFIARASELVFESLDLQSSFDRLCDFLVTDMADLAYIMRFDTDGGLRTVACAHRDPNMRGVADRLRGQRTLKPEAEEGAGRVLAQHRTILHRDVTIDQILPSMWEYLAADIRALQPHSGITVPLFGRGETLGALVVYWCDRKRAYTEDDVPIFEDLGRRVSVAMENFTAFERERRIAAELQRALLPTDQMLPSHPDMQFSAEYRPSLTEAEVGGDWFDAFTRADGSILVCVGDVVGRGLGAAGLMGKMRQAIGVSAHYEDEPSAILDSVDAYVRARRHEALATAFVGIIDRQHRTMRYASAGHPPPLLRRGDTLTELRGNGLPIGLRDMAKDSSFSVALEDYDLLLLYTDGLTEATRDWAFGERRLREVAGSDAIMNVNNAARLLCDACLPRDAQDDTAVLAVRFGARPHWHFDAENAEAAAETRRAFVAKLKERTQDAISVESGELIFGELVGNVVRHAPGPIDVQLDLSGESPVLHVIDRGRGFIRNAALPTDPLSENGRGLFIIEQLAKDVRVERVPGYGNHVAVTLRT